MCHDWFYVSGHSLLNANYKQKGKFQFGTSINVAPQSLLLALLVAELRRPEGTPSEAPYSYRKEKETHELIFSWL